MSSPAQDVVGKNSVVIELEAPEQQASMDNQHCIVDLTERKAWPHEECWAEGWHMAEEGEQKKEAG